MFMSTLYKKRPEPTAKQKLLFTVDDSLVKLFEYLTLEFSCNQGQTQKSVQFISSVCTVASKKMRPPLFLSKLQNFETYCQKSMEFLFCRKLITPKWKDFRSQKLQFDQKTRLNNAIWRAWHIQYKMKKKARFFQFAAPFSDESVHSTSQAVILEGKYWKRRLDGVSREYKKWRRLHKEKLLKSDTAKKEDLEESEEEFFEEDEHEDAENQKSNGNSKTGCIHDMEQNVSMHGLESWSAMYALSDTLFSSVDTKKLRPLEDDSSLSFYKDSSVMIQPTIDHLNPCFDELMENFDFLFSDWSTTSHQVDSIHPGEILTSNSPYDDSPSPQSFGNAYLSIDTSKKILPLDHKAGDVRYTSDNQFNKHIFPQSIANKNIMLKNSCAHESQKGCFQNLPPQLEAPNLTAHLQSVMLSKAQPSLKTFTEPSVTHAKRIKPQVENVSAPQKKPRMKKRLSSSREFESNDTISSTFTQTYPYLASQKPIPIHPKTQPIQQINSVSTQGGIYESNFSIPRPDNVNATISSKTARHQEYRGNLISDSSSTSLLGHIPNNILQPAAATSQDCNIKAQTSFSTPIAPAINDQQLLTLAALLQCSQPAQSTEATLAYLELLQQQLQLLLKQQQELQMKYQIQQHSERVIKQHEHQLQSPVQQAGSDCMQQHQNQPPYLQQHSQIHQHHQAVMDPSLGNQTVMYTTSQKDFSSSLIEESKDTCKFVKSSSINEYAAPLEIKNPLKKIPDQNSLIKTLHRKLDYKPREISFCDASTSSQTVILSTPKFSPVTTPTQHLLDLAASPSVTSLEWNHIETANEHQWSKPPPTTLDSAMALVSLRHGTSSISPYYPLQQTTTVQSSDISSSLPQANESVQNTVMHEGKMKSIPVDHHIHNEHRRQLHLTAEQKRRGIIKNAFEDLASLLPSPAGTITHANKLTNASILQKTCEYVTELQRKKNAQEFRINQLKQEIEQSKTSIAECHNKIPDLSSSEFLPQQKASNDVEKEFIAYCKELIYANPKSWIFCQIMRPLFNSYNSSVATKTLDHFVSSAITWLERYSTLSAMRTIVLNTLTKLSTSTSLLDDPTCLVELVNAAVRENDPTLIPPSNTTKR